MIGLSSAVKPERVALNCVQNEKHSFSMCTRKDGGTILVTFVSMERTLVEVVLTGCVAAARWEMAKVEWRIYKSAKARRSAFTQILKHNKFNYIVFYRDTRGPALNLANAPWVQPGRKYVI